MAFLSKLSAASWFGPLPKCPTCQMRQAWVAQQSASRLLLVCAFCRHSWAVPNLAEDAKRPHSRRRAVVKVRKKRARRTRASSR